VSPIVGRTYMAAEDLPNAPKVAVIGFMLHTMSFSVVRRVA
jgi:hypothetical protein